ncbi:MAG: TonB-dependent receptor [Alphaproteobacteria bacterium]|nr:TonB-dependent receptor [Alphaproteobacteria bacterium]
MHKRHAALAIPAAAILVAMIAVFPAHAQRAGENAVTQADDAFGTSVGNEKIGIYNENNVRGFSPILAGNERIEGLYFDKVGDANDRIQASSRIRVGIAAQGFAFPAPTGIVDFSLRTQGKKARVSAFSEVNSWGTYNLQFDAVMPLAEGFSLGGGVGTDHNLFPDGGANYESNIGLLAHWLPLPEVEILPFWSRKDTYIRKVGESYQPSGEFLPDPMPERHFLGPEWATHRDFSYNYGSLVNVTLSSWRARLGIFRSEFASPKNSFPLLASLDRTGRGELQVKVSPASYLGSTSGEFRLEKTFGESRIVQRLILSLRGRNWNGRYGNSVTADVGPQAINEYMTAPIPVISFAPLIHDHVDESWIGLGYQVAWLKRLQMSLGVQKARYHKRAIASGGTATELNAAPWLLTGSATADLSDSVQIFGSYTQGLEENGIAPSNAINGNQALPATVTRQEDAGIRWQILPGASLVADIFDLKKFYFNLDPTHTYRNLGTLENKGLELSLSGNVTDQINIVAGAMLSEPAVGGEAVRLGISGDRPVGITPRKLIFAANWRPSGMKGISFDLGLNHFGNVPATLSGVAVVPAYSTIDWDTRYEFLMGHEAASLKLAVMNMLNVRSFQVSSAGTYGFTSDSGRKIDLRLIVDFT